MRKRRKKYDWQREYKCDHHGAARWISDNVRKRKRRISTRCNCPALLRVSCLAQSSNIIVEHLGAHVNHDPTSLEDRKRARMAPLLREWLNDKLADGHDPATLRRLLRFSDDDLDKIEDDPAAAPDAFFLSDDDFANLFRRILSKEGKLDVDLWKSLDKWVLRVEELGGSVLLKCWNSNKEKQFQFCFMTKWQKKLVSEGIGSNIVCLAATHNTSFTMEWGTGHCPLFSLVAKHHASGMGVPLAFPICSSEEHQPLQAFLSWTTTVSNYKPAAVMIDCSATEALAIEKAWPTAKIRYCRWHLFRSVWKQLRQKVKVSPKSKSKADQTAAMAETHQTRITAQRDLNHLLAAPNIPAFEDRWQLFKAKWSKWKDWIKYVEDQWLKTHERWAEHGRTLADHSIITNMYIESWHGTLKGKHLGNRRKQRVDLLLHILVDEAMPSLRTRVLKIQFDVNHRQRSKAEEPRLKQAYQLPMHQAQEMIEPVGDIPGSMIVQSFTSEKKYRSRLEGEAISDCSCPDYTHNHLQCKHMHLVARVLPFSLEYKETAIAARAGIGRVESVNAREAPEAVGEHSPILAAVDHNQLDYLRQWMEDFNKLDVVERNSARMRETAVIVGQKLQDAFQAAQNARRSHAARQK